jgi:hypothetical protein
VKSLPKHEHTSRPWRVHELTRDFEVEDVWALPTPGGPDDFPQLLELVTSLDIVNGGDFPAGRVLFAVRWKLGALFGWDRPDDAVGSRVQPVADRLPDDLRGTVVERISPEGDPFTDLYVLADEYASEYANRTMHGVMHLGWVPDGAGGYHGQMAVLVKPNGLFGRAYMAFIRPFRYHLVYPSIMRTVTRAWQARRPLAGAAAGGAR